MSFLDLALQYAARGFHVHPLTPGGKRPITAHGLKDATTDAEQIRAWWTKWPEANIGIACGPSGIAVMDVDHGISDEAAFLKWREAAGLPESYTVRTGRRPEFGVQMYFAGAVPDVGLWKLAGCEGQIKSLGGYVCAAGSLHPSGHHYEVLIDAPVTATPDAVRELRTFKLPVTDGPMEKIPEGAGRHAALTSVAGKLRNSGMDADAILAALIPCNESMCAVPVPHDDLEHIARSVCRYPVPEPEPELIISDKPAAPAEAQAEDLLIEPEARPVYPDDAWSGTAYAEFAELCTQDNKIPKKFFIEALRTAVGAIMGNRLRTTLDAVNPRSFTIFIAPPQKGKGTSISRVQMLFQERWDSLTRTESPLLFTDSKSYWKPKGVGAQIINPASAPGLMLALVPSGKKDADPVTWQPIPRLLTMMEEVRGLFANFTLESTGAGLEGILCELYDRTSFSATATAKRAPMSGEAMLSILGGITPEEWEKIFSQTNSAGSGFLSRLNIIGSEGGFPRASDIELPDFAEFRRSFFPRLMALMDQARVLKPTPAAKDLMGDWFQGVEPANAARINIHAWRTALHIAWLHNSEFITEEHVRRGIEIAEYQLAMRDFYAAGEGETRAARCEAQIRKVIRRGPLSLSQLKYKTNYTRYGIGFWNKCLAELVKAGEIRLDGRRVIPLKTQE